MLCSAPVLLGFTKDKLRSARLRLARAHFDWAWLGWAKIGYTLLNSVRLGYNMLDLKLWESQDRAIVIRMKGQEPLKPHLSQDRINRFFNASTFEQSDIASKSNLSNCTTFERNHRKPRKTERWLWSEMTYCLNTKSSPLTKPLKIFKNSWI